MRQKVGSAFFIFMLVREVLSKDTLTGERKAIGPIAQLVRAHA